MRDFLDVAVSAEAEIWLLLSEGVKAEFAALTENLDVNHQTIVGDVAFWTAMSRNLGGSLSDLEERQRGIGLKLVKDAQAKLQATRKLFERAQKIRHLHTRFLFSQLYFDEMSATTENWLKNFEELGADLTNLKPASHPDAKLRHDFIFAAACNWKDATGKVASIDRRGPFLKYLELFRRITPTDCRPDEFSPETVKKWLSKNRPLLMRGRITF